MGFPILGDIVSGITGLAGKFIKDKDKLAEFEHELAMTLPKMDMAQMEVNKAEAAHGSIFVAGGRPFIVWVCGFALAFEFLGRPLVQWGLLMYGSDVVLPELDTDKLYPILMGLLGLGTLRTFEKSKGVARKSLEE